jgi:hypothetical protein
VNKLLAGKVVVAGLAWLVSTSPATGLAASPGPATITISVDSGVPGATVAVTGRGFPAGQIVALYIDSPISYLLVPGPQVDEQGTFTGSFIWPGKDYDPSGHIDPSAPGAHNVCGYTPWADLTQQVAAPACAPFLVPVLPPGRPNEGFPMLLWLSLGTFGGLVLAAVFAVLRLRKLE